MSDYSGVLTERFKTTKMTNEQFTKIGNKTVVWAVGAGTWVTLLGGSFRWSIIGGLISAGYLIYSEVRALKKEKTLKTEQHNRDDDHGLHS